MDKGSKLTKQILDFDGLAAAEGMTGKSYKEDEGTQALGFLLSMEGNKAKADVLHEQGDSNYGTTIVEYVKIITSLGFYKIYEEPFMDGDVENMFYCYWHDDGILLKFDTFTWPGSNEGQVLNGGNFYYSIKPKVDDPLFWTCTSSGGYRDGIWVGDHDCREAIKFNILQLRAHGDFIKPWTGHRFLWLLNYMEPKVEGYDHEAISNSKIAKFPEHVREAMGYKEEE